MLESVYNMCITFLAHILYYKDKKVKKVKVKVKKVRNKNKIKKEERFDKYKTRIFKFVLYKPRTEKEVYYKFKSFENSELYLEKVIEILKELKYIDDRRYAEMYIEDSLNIKRLSRFELKNKLREKGIKNQDIYDAFEKFEEELRSKEIENAINILKKKEYVYLEDEKKKKVENYLYRKGYTHESISLGKEEVKYLHEKGEL